MERPEIPIYSLAEILSMDSSHVRIFLLKLRIPLSNDARGKIALKLNQLGKLTYPPPINSINLAGLIKITKPSRITETQNIVRAAGITPSNNRLQLMIQYLSYATIPLAESPRFLPLKAEIPVVGGLQFAELPTEMQLEILGRVSPTVREAALVSRGMQELADTALLTNIQVGDLVDPTLGIPDRAEYFKLKPGGLGDYFAPLPGLWQSLKEARQYYQSRGQYLLIYGVINLAELRDTLPTLRFKPISKLSESETINWLNNIITEYGTDKIKFVGIAVMESSESLMTGPSSDLPSSTIGISFISLPRGKLHIVSLGVKMSNSSQVIKLVKQITENTNIEQIFVPTSTAISIAWSESFLSKADISLRMVALNTNDLLNGTLILPSLRDDVYDVN